MIWRTELAPDVERDIADAATWYDQRQPGLGSEFIEEIIDVLFELSRNPLLNCRRHPVKNIRWRYPKRFPYRVVYEVDERGHIVQIAAVLHAARHDNIGKTACNCRRSHR